jgi:signal peptide peptidase SppA
MKHALIVAEFLSTPWAILPERLSAISAVVMRLAEGEQASAEVMEMVAADAATMAARRNEAQRTAGGGIAVLPFYGVSTQRPPPAMASGSGLMSTQQFASGLRAAVADDSVAGILIDIDSPGGSVFGVQELSNEIYQARSQKPVIAIANSLAASAAYWIGSSASELYVTPGGEVGSIGVFAAHQNRSQALEKEGVETTLISAGKYKVEGSPFGPLSEEAKAFMQTRIDAHYGAFTRDVARNLGTNVDAVRNGMGEGRTLGASAAKAAGMVAGVMTFDQVLQKMARDIGAGKGNARAGNRAAAMRRDIDILSA